MNSILFLSLGNLISYDCDKNFYEPLQQLFSRVINYNFYKRAAEIGEPAMNREVISLVRNEKPDYVFIHTYRHELFKNTLRQIASMGIPNVLWFSDDHWRFDDYSRFWKDVAQYSITTDHLSIPKYQNLNIPVILSQWAANPDLYHPVDCSSKLDVTFVGARMPSREALVEGLADRGVNVDAYGRDWPNGQVSFEEMVRTFSCSRINLNSSDYWGGPEYKQIKGRVFEVVMSGGLLLTDYVYGLDEYFELNKEILVYEDLDQAADLIHYYLEHEEERAAIAMAGYKRALRDHTWKQRLRDLFLKVDFMENEPKKKVIPSSAINSPEHLLPLKPQAARVLEARVNTRMKAEFSIANNAHSAISTDDIRDGLVHVLLNDVQFFPVDEFEEQSPNIVETGSVDLIFALRTIDRIDEPMEDFFSECSRALSSAGLLIGSSWLWYSDEPDLIQGHKHKDYRVVSTPTQIKAQLKRYFKEVVLVEVHRPLGPMGPYIAFFASKNSERMKDVDIQSIIRHVTTAASEFSENEYHMNINWSWVNYSRGNWKPSIFYALRAFLMHPENVGSWKALIRSLLGKSFWEKMMTRNKFNRIGNILDENEY
jgi:spore maturation protein CgeB